MDIKPIKYFFDCYLMMLDDDEKLEKIISDFIKNENAENVKNLKNECATIIAMCSQERKTWIEKVLLSCENLDIDEEEMNEIIKFIYREI